MFIYNFIDTISVNFSAISKVKCADLNFQLKTHNFKADNLNLTNSQLSLQILKIQYLADQTLNFQMLNNQYFAGQILNFQILNIQYLAD